MSLLANPWALLTLGAVIVGALGGSYVKGRSDGRAIEYAERMELEEVARISREAGLQAAAEAIAKQKVVHTTIRGRVEREVIEKPVYRDCTHPDATLRLLNDALANRAPEPTSSGELPGTDAP